MLLDGCVDSGAIDGNISSFKCSFEGDYEKFETLTKHYWTIEDIHKTLIKLYENSTYNKYSAFVKVYPDCLSSDNPCCIVTSELVIDKTFISLNKAVVKCYAGFPLHGSTETNSSAHLSKYVYKSLYMANVHDN